jgi:pimeloyl-ACP methyl ester carboxylesterase
MSLRRVGVEEEFLLVEPGTGRPRAVAGTVLQAARHRPAGPAARDAAQALDYELQLQQVETNTQPCRSLDELGGEIRRCRALAADAAGRAGVQEAALATSPVPVEPQVAAGAGGFGSVVPYLAADYTVVTYDRRGLSRSPLDDPGQDPAITIATHSQDVHRILTVLGAAPAVVFGSSIGALIGLDLLIRHPGDVRVLVAHEPPLGSPPAGDQKPAASVTGTCQQTGEADAALSQFAASLTPEHLLPLLPGLQPGDPARARNAEFFLTNDAPAVQHYELDLDALKQLMSQLVIGGGRDGREFPPYASASRLAGRLGIGLREFPGHHAGYALYPAEFARSLRQVFRAGRAGHRCRPPCRATLSGPASRFRPERPAPLRCRR